jgi:small subunit ribosomal protein S1
MSQEDKLAALILERKENLPQKDTIIQAKIIAINTNGLYLDINKSFEAYISQKELSENTENYKVGDTIEAYVLGEDKNQSGIFRLSTKQIDAEKKWQKLEELLNQELEVRISKAVKSGLEVTIISTEDLAFIPNSCLDAQAVALRNQKPEQWIGTTITARLQEIDRSKNKIILNHKLVSERLKQENFAKVFSSLEIGQNLDLEIIRLAEFGAFVDINGVDALVPASELSWQRF